MSFSKIEICNLAISRIGISKRIANIDEKSLEAEQCNRWYDVCRKFVLRDLDWNCARRRQALALSDDDPPSTWAYVYAYPNKCAAVRSIVPPGVRYPRKDQKIPYEVALKSDGSGLVVYTDLKEAEAIFTYDLEDPTLFDAHFVSAHAYLIASEIAIPLSVKPDLAKQARDAYVALKSHAGASNAREGETGPEPEGEYLTYRNA